MDELLLQNDIEIWQASGIAGPTTTTLCNIDFTHMYRDISYSGMNKYYFYWSYLKKKPKSHIVRCITLKQ